MATHEVPRNKRGTMAQRPTEAMPPSIAAMSRSTEIQRERQRETQSVPPAIEGTTNSIEVQPERRRPGRPKGSKSKPKPLIPKELASEFLGVIKDVIPSSYYDEMKLAIKQGKAISTITEAKITLKLMGPAIWKRLITEGVVREDGTLPEFSRDLNERLKVYTGLMAFIEKVEGDDEGTSSKEKPIIEIFARRGLSAERLGLLVGFQPSDMGGDTDGTGGEPRRVGAIPDTVPQRQVNVSDSEQVEADWLFDDNRD